MNFNKSHVLAVDDDEFNLEIIVEYLEGEDYLIETAQDGKQAWNMLETRPEQYDVVLLDWMMPVMTGLEVLKRIKNHPTLKLLPVIMQTARSGRSDIAEGLHAGAYYYLTKPFDGEILRSILKTAVTDRQRYVELQEALREGTRSLQLMRQGSFVFKSLEEAKVLSTLLANATSQPGRVAAGLSELLVNAVEHGNLEISYDDKTELNKSGGWRDEVEARLMDPRYRNRQVEVSYQRDDRATVLIITDMGAGFDWREYLEMTPERAFDSHGRGIALAKTLSFDRVDFNECGNQVTVSIDELEQSDDDWSTDLSATDTD